MSQYKVCKDCVKAKPLSLYTPVNKSATQFKSRCKPCRAERQKKYVAENKLKTELVKTNGVLALRKFRSRRPFYAINDFAKRKAFALGVRVYLVTEKDISAVLSQGCAGCGVNTNLSIDHVIPLSRGGPHSVGNLQCLCRRCNTSKNNKFITEWKKVRPW